jgi:hypothetical protein
LQFDKVSATWFNARGMCLMVNWYCWSQSTHRISLGEGLPFVSIRSTELLSVFCASKKCHFHLWLRLPFQMAVANL